MPRNREEPGVSEGSVRDGPRTDDFLDALQYAFTSICRTEAIDRVTTIRPAQAPIRGLRFDGAVLDDIEEWPGLRSAGAATSTISTGTGTSLTAGAIRNAVWELERPLDAARSRLWSSYAERFRQLMGSSMGTATQEWQYDPTLSRTRSARAAYDRDHARCQAQTRIYRVAIHIDLHTIAPYAWEAVRRNIYREVNVRLPASMPDGFVAAYERALMAQHRGVWDYSFRFEYDWYQFEVLFAPRTTHKPMYPKGHQFDLFPAELAEAIRLAPQKTQEDEDVG